MATAADANASVKARVKALTALGGEKDTLAAIDAIAKVFGSREDGIRDAAVAALRKQLQSNDFPAKLNDKKTPLRSRQNILKALRYLKDEKQIPRIAEQLKSPEPSLRAEAALTLSAVGPAQAEAALIQAVDDEDKDVRYYAIEALGTVRTPAAKAAIAAREKIEQDTTVQYILIQTKRKQAAE